MLMFTIDQCKIIVFGLLQGIRHGVFIEEENRLFRHSKQFLEQRLLRSVCPGSKV